MLRLYLLLAAALGLALAWNALRQRGIVRSKEARWRQLALECTTGSNSATSVFMVLLCRGPEEVESTADTLVHLFDNSSCPQHITAGVYEVVPDLRAASAVAARYAALAPSANRLGRSFSDRIRSVKVPAVRAMPPDAARGFVLSQAYGGEAFVGTVASGVQVLEGWDSKLLEARRRAANPLACVVSPPAAPPPSANVGLALKRGDSQWSDLLNSFGQRLSASPPAQSALEPSFLVIAESQRGHWPRISARSFARPDTDAPQPSLFWTGELSLGPASALVKPEQQRSRIGGAAPFGSGPRAASLRAADYTTSLNLWSAGWEFTTPCVPCARWATAHALRAYDGASAEIDAAWLDSLAQRPRTLADFQAFSSTDPTSGQVFARAALGVSPLHAPREIVAKYGSLSGFAAEKEALLMELSHTLQT